MGYTTCLGFAAFKKGTVPSSRAALGRTIPNATAIEPYHHCGRAGTTNRVMTRIVYEIVEHDSGWAYRVDGVYSETFRSHDAARAAAERAAGEQRVPGETRGIVWEDAQGHWRGEVSEGDDRPTTEVEG